MNTSAARRTAAEALGTFFLVLIGPGAVMVDAYSGGALSHVGVALAFAFVVLAMVYAIGHLSGAHINPAVTLAFWSVGRFPFAEVIPYVAAQCIGAVAASSVSRWALGTAGAVGATLPALPIPAAFGVEWLLSFVLMFVIMAVATDRRVPDGFAPIAVGLTVGFCALVGGPLTGASMNPARSLGPAIAGGLWHGHWLYWVAPITGMMAAARVYDALRHPEPRGPADAAPLGLEGPVWTGADSKLMQEQPVSRLSRVTVGITTVLMFGAAAAMFLVQAEQMDCLELSHHAFPSRASSPASGFGILYDRPAHGESRCPNA